MCLGEWQIFYVGVSLCLYDSDVVQRDCGKSLEKRLKYFAEQRTFARMSKMSVVILHSSFKGNWKEKVIPHSAMGEKITEVKTEVLWRGIRKDRCNVC